MCGEAFPAILYIATDKNCHWLGEENLPLIANQITDSNGPSGHNVEYLLRLAMFMREELPEADDEHLFSLEKLVRDKLIKNKICLTSIMGEMPEPIRRNSHEEVRTPASFEFTSRVPAQKLRCLNI